MMEAARQAHGVQRGCCCLIWHHDALAVPVAQPLMMKLLEQPASIKLIISDDDPPD
jgi:hypothetical protein